MSAVSQVKYDPGEIPESLRSRMVLKDGVWHFSSELRGKPELDAFIAIEQRKGILHFKAHPAEEFNSQYVQALSGSAVGANFIQDYAINLLKKARELEASDIHITNYGDYTIVALRILGSVRHYDQLSGDEGGRVISCMFQSFARENYSESESHDGRIGDKSVLPDDVYAVRLHSDPIQSVYSKSGEGTYLAARLLYDVTKAEGTLEERTARLGFTPEQRGILADLTHTSGLIVVSGPTGQGKTTLLRAVFEAMAEEQPDKNYLSAEDPPEFPLKGVKQKKIDTSKARDDEERNLFYGQALAELMRADPNTILIGEVRYPSAASAAIQAALTGHAVWTTVHASNALAIVSRFRELGIALASLCNPNVLTGLTYQRLIPLLCPNCKKPLFDDKKAISGELYKRIGDMMDLEGVFVRGPGCAVCNDRKLKDQTVAAEVIRVDSTLLGYLREEKLVDAYRYWIESCNGFSHLDHATLMVKNGLVDPHVAETRLGVPLNYALYDRKR